MKQQTNKQHQSVHLLENLTNTDFDTIRKNVLNPALASYVKTSDLQSQIQSKIQSVQSVQSQNSQITVNSFTQPKTQGGYAAWNRDGKGMTAFVNQRGDGSGGFEFLSYDKSNNFIGFPMVITSNNTDISGSVTSNLNDNPIRISSNWDSYSDKNVNNAQISNDTNQFKELMVMGNKSSNPNERRVGIWDRLNVHGNVFADGTIDASAFTIKGVPINVTSNHYDSLITPYIIGPTMIGNTGGSSSSSSLSSSFIKTGNTWVSGASGEIPISFLSLFNNNGADNLSGQIVIHLKNTLPNANSKSGIIKADVIKRWGHGIGLQNIVYSYDNINLTTILTTNGNDLVLKCPNDNDIFITYTFIGSS